MHGVKLRLRASCREGGIKIGPSGRFVTAWNANCTGVTEETQGMATWRSNIGPQSGPTHFASASPPSPTVPPGTPPPAAHLPRQTRCLSLAAAKRVSSASSPQRRVHRRTCAPTGPSAPGSRLASASSASLRKPHRACAVICDDGSDVAPARGRSAQPSRAGADKTLLRTARDVRAPRRLARAELAPDAHVHRYLREGAARPADGLARVAARAVRRVLVRGGVAECGVRLGAAARCGSRRFGHAECFVCVVAAGV